MLKAGRGAGLLPAFFLAARQGRPPQLGRPACFSLSCVPSAEGLALIAVERHEIALIGKRTLHLVQDLL